MGSGITAASGEGVEEVAHLAVGGIELEDLLADRFSGAEVVDLPVQACECQESVELVGCELLGALEHGDGFLPVVVLINALGQESQEGGIARRRRPCEGRFCSGTVAGAQQGLTEIEHRAVAQRPQIDQLGKGLDGSLVIATVEPPKA